MPPLERLKTTSVIEWTSGSEHSVADDLAVEEPLEIRVGGVSVSVTMRTPGDDFELPLDSSSRNGSSNVAATSLALQTGTDRIRR